VFGIGPSELLIVLFLVFVFLGPKRLPTAGRMIGEFARKLQNLKEEISTDITETKKKHDSQQ